MSIFVSTWCF